MRPGRPVVVSDPLPPQSVLDAAERIGADLWRFGRDFNYAGDRQQWNWAGPDAALQLRSAIRRCAAPTSCSTRRAALAAFEALRERLPITAQAVRTGLALVELPGRFQIVPGQPTLVLDVAHNPHAVATLAQNLDQMGFFPRTHAVFGAMRDKDIDAILARMAPLVDTGISPTCRRPRAARRADTRRDRSARDRRPRKDRAESSVSRHSQPGRSARRGAARRRPR